MKIFPQPFRLMSRIPSAQAVHRTKELFLFWLFTNSNPEELFHAHQHPHSPHHVSVCSASAGWWERACWNKWLLLQNRDGVCRQKEIISSSLHPTFASTEGLTLDTPIPLRKTCYKTNKEIFLCLTHIMAESKWDPNTAPGMWGRRCRAGEARKAVTWWQQVTQNHNGWKRSSR